MMVSKSYKKYLIQKLILNLSNQSRSQTMFKGGMAGMMQKAKQMQEDMEAVQKRLNLLSCEGDAGSGAVKVEMNGDYRSLISLLLNH